MFPVVTVILLAALWRMNKRGSKYPPGLLSYPLVGNLFNVDFENFLEEMRRLRKQYGEIFSLMVSYKVYKC